MIQRLDCSNCGVNQADIERPFIALPIIYICHDCYKKQKSLEERIQEFEIAIECAIEDLKAWHCLSDECGRRNIERFVKDLELTLKGEIKWKCTKKYIMGM